MADKSLGDLIGVKSNVVEPPTEPKEVVATEPVVTNKNEPPQKEEPKVEKKEEPKQASWLDEANKLYKTQFKSPEDFGARLERAKKADEYEPRISEWENKEKTYKKQIDDLQSSLNPLSYFSSPQAYVAEQLRRQHPDKSPMVLQQIVTSDTKVMSDLDVLVKDQLLQTPDLIGGESGAKEYLLDKYGISPDSTEDEWSIAQKNKIKIEANVARKAWEELKKTVTLPSIQTPEEKEAQMATAREERQKQLSPLRETFSKFDKYAEEIEPGKVFEFNVPDEYKEALPEMFDGYFLEAGKEPTQDDLAAMEEIKKGLFLARNFKQIYKVIEGDVQTRERADRDKLLNNTKPLNTQSAAELGDNDKMKFSKEHGLGKLLGS